LPPQLDKTRAATIPARGTHARAIGLAIRTPKHMPVLRQVPKDRIVSGSFGGL
jgi:hypothetical protein